MGEAFETNAGDRGSRPIPATTRFSVLCRAKGRCEDCGCSAELELHHLHYRTVGFEIPTDLMALCRACHKGRHVDCLGEWHTDPEQKADAMQAFTEGVGWSD